MPELPEVETIRRELQRALKGKIINGLEARWPGAIRPLSPAEFLRRVGGEKITSVERRAKILIIKLSSGEQLLIHLKMTGQLIYIPPRPVSLPKGVGKKRKNTPSPLPEEEGGRGEVIVGGHPQRGGTENLPNKFTRVVVSFGDKSKLYFNDLRKFGWMRLLTAPEADKILELHGVEPLSRDFTYEHFSELLSRYPKRKIKQVLLDQAIIAGLGNIYTDESCFRAKIRLTRLVGSLTTTEKKNLHCGIVNVLNLSLRKKGTSARNYRRANGRPGGFFPYLNVYERTGGHCRRCKKGIIKKIKLDGRGTYYCPRCQK